MDFQRVENKHSIFIFVSFLMFRYAPSIYSGRIEQADFPWLEEIRTRRSTLENRRCIFGSLGTDYLSILFLWIYMKKHRKNVFILNIEWFLIKTCGRKPVKRSCNLVAFLHASSSICTALNRHENLPNCGLLTITVLNSLALFTS